MPRHKVPNPRDEAIDRGEPMAGTPGSLTVRSYERVRDFWLKVQDNYPRKEDLRCNRCPVVSNCVYAWDDHNVDGACLVEK